MFRKSIKYILLGAIIVGVGWMFATGRFSAREAGDLSRRAYYQGKGAVQNLKEFSPSSGSYNDAARCRENLKMIELAKRKAAALKNQESGFVTVQEVEAVLKGPVPACPSGGQYSINPLVQLPTCSIGSQDNLDANDDHILRHF